MLLPADALAYTIVDRRIVPVWLGEGDEPFVASVLDAVAALEGLTAADAEVAVGRILDTLARDARVSRKVAEALWVIERRRWDARVDAPVAPESLRDVVFELAARMPRESAIALAASRLRIPEEVVVGSLFADRRGRRVLVAPAPPTRARDLVARYNLTLAQSLLARSMQIEATVAGEPASILGAAKRDGLLARFESRADETWLELAGPLALFRDTAKYGRSIARFVPALVATSRWSLRAHVTLGARSAELALEHTGAIAFASTMPAAPDGRLARRVARTLGRAGVRVDLHPELVRMGTSLVVPDFALEWPDGRVLVDVVPFATAEYLACKAEAVATSGVPMIVCVDERFASLAPVEGPWLVRYRGEIDAWALHAAARLALEARAGVADDRSRLSASRASLSPAGPTASLDPAARPATPACAASPRPPPA